MDPDQKDSPLLWTAGLAVVGLTFLYVWLLRDPMLVYLMLVTALMAAFPTYRPLVAAVSLYGVLRISIRHDPVTGDFMSFVSSVAEAVNITVGGTAMVVTFMSLAPLVGALFTFDLGSIKQAIVPALPLLTLVCTKYFVEMQADADLTQLIAGSVEHLREFAKNLRAIINTFTA